MEVDDCYSSDEEIKDLGQKYSELEANDKRLLSELNECSDDRNKWKMIFDELSEKYKKSEENLKALSTEYQRLNNEYNNCLNENNDLKDQLSSLRTDNKKLRNGQKNDFNEINKLKVHLESLSIEDERLKKVQTDYEAMCNEDDKLKAQPKKSNEIEEIRKNEEYVKEINNLTKLLQKKEKEKQDLIEKNTKLKSRYESELNSVINFPIIDDKNHSVQLKKDIEELQIKLKNYVTTLKGDFEIDFKAVNELMEKYKIKTKVTPTKPNKPLIKAVLQHHVLKRITKEMNKYFKHNSGTELEIHLEAEIASKAKDLENKLAYLSKTRCGTDTVTQAASIKIRQEVNIALDNRGFSDILDGNIPKEHVFIILHKNELNKEMNKYRIIKDETKRKYVEKLAPDLIREFIRIIQFRLKVQEPSAQVRWIKVDSSIDPSIMEGSWDKDDIDNLEVGVCSFPLIGRDLDDMEKRKIYTHAQVFTRRKKFPLYINNTTKGFSIWPKKDKGNLEPESDDEIE
jgi:hypothetical protein